MPAAWPRLCHYFHAALRGGILYDALQLRCAEKRPHLYLSDFVRLAPQLGNRVLRPYQAHAGVRLDFHGVADRPGWIDENLQLISLAATNFPFCGATFLLSPGLSDV